MPHTEIKVLNNTPTVLTSSWNTLVTKDVSLLDDERGPLVNLVTAAAYFQLPELPPLTFGRCLDGNYLAQNGSVRELDEKALILLRKQIFSNNLNDNLFDLAEKILRYCEIQRLGLWRQLRRRFGDKLQTELYLLQLVAFLVDFYYLRKDIRFLNAGLKVYETRWRGNLNLSFSRLDTGGLRFVCALFHVRFVILSEHAIRRLSGGF